MTDNDHQLFPFADPNNAAGITRLPTRDEALTLATVNAMNRFPEEAQFWLNLAEALPVAMLQEAREALIDHQGDLWIRQAGGAYLLRGSAIRVVLLEDEIRRHGVRHRVLIVDKPNE